MSQLAHEIAVPVPYERALQLVIEALKTEGFGVLTRIDIHDAFKAHVKARRGDRLSDDKDLFTGSSWTGAKSVELGLADGIGHLVPKMKELHGDKTRFAVYGPKRSLWQRFGAQIAQDFGRGLEEQALWARYGLS